MSSINVEKHPHLFPYNAVGLEVDYNRASSFDYGFGRTADGAVLSASGAGCFSRFWGFLGGGELGVMLDPDALRNRLFFQNTSFFPNDVATITKKWYEEVNVNFFPVWMDKKYTDYATFSSVDHPRANTIRMMFLSIPLRYPGVFLVYTKLRELLPEENPWYLMQIAHFIPFCDPIIQWSPRAKEVISGTLAESIVLPGGNANHSLHDPWGITLLESSFDSRLFQALDCMSFLGERSKRDDKKFPDLTLKWEGFAEWAKAYIDDGANHVQAVSNKAKRKRALEQLA
jgi:hypothetical protein